MRHLAPWLVVLGLVAASSPALAQSQDVPVGQFGFTAVLRQNQGALGDLYGSGYMVGFTAGYQLAHLGQSGGLGLEWSTVWGWFGATDPTLVDDPLRITEMSLGVHLRRQLGEAAPRFVALSTGATFLRTNVPVPPDDQRRYLGGYLGVGIEQWVLGKMLLGLEARYALLGSGPGALSIGLGVSFGQ